MKANGACTERLCCIVATGRCGTHATETCVSDSVESFQEHQHIKTMYTSTPRLPAPTPRIYPQRAAHGVPPLPSRRHRCRRRSAVGNVGYGRHCRLRSPPRSPRQWPVATAGWGGTRRVAATATVVGMAPLPLRSPARLPRPPPL